MGRLAPPRPISSTRGLDVTAQPTTASNVSAHRKSTGRATPHTGRPPADRSRTRRDPDDKPVSRLGGGPGVPVDWSRSTLAHLRSVYPFHTAAGFGERGVLLGSDVTGGFRGFYFDPFEFYHQRHLTNPNMIVMGSVGFGKSATVKALIRRLQAVYGTGRYLAIIDPKGEYSTVAADLGLAVIKLFPGEGGARVNPMDPGSTSNDDSVIARQTLAAQLVAGVLGRELTPLEDAVLSWGIETRCRANQAVHSRRPAPRNPRPTRRTRPPLAAHAARTRPGHVAGHVRARQAVLAHIARHVRRPHHRARRLGQRTRRRARPVRRVRQQRSPAVGDGRRHPLAQRRAAWSPRTTIRASDRRSLGRGPPRSRIPPRLTQAVTHLRGRHRAGLPSPLRPHRTSRRRHRVVEDRRRAAVRHPDPRAAAPTA